MGLLNKTENWWLKLSIVIVVLFSTILLATINRTVGEQIKSLQETNDSLETEVFIQKNMVGRYELSIQELIDEKKLDSTDFENALKNRE